MEKIKTVLLILFLAGIVGAFNTIIRLSQQDNRSPLEYVAGILGLAPKAEPEPKRKVDYVFDKLAQGKNQPGNSQPQAEQASESFTPALSPTPSPATITAPASRPAPTPTPSAIQTTPDLPPLPVLGAATAPELPPLEVATDQPPAKQGPEFPSISSFWDGLLEFFK